MGKKPDKPDKAAAKPKKVGNKKAKYTLSGKKVVRPGVECPRCGPGYFMASHYNRRTCGHCSYTQFVDREGNVRGAGPGGFGGPQAGAPGGGGVQRQSRRVRRPDGEEKE